MFKAKAEAVDGLEKEEVLRDIEAVHASEEHREKLYRCVDDKAPRQENDLKKMEEFLRGTRDIEDILKTLNALQKETAVLKEELARDADALKRKLEDAIADGSL